MKKVGSVFKTLAVVGIIFCFVGVNSVSATRAITERGTGCYVRVGTGENDYSYDGACTSHDVTKLDNEGNFEFYSYQDHGQLPEGSWLPDKAYRNTFEVCYAFSFGVVCGTVEETVLPGGEYKSSFKSHGD